MTTKSLLLLMLAAVALGSTGCGGAGTTVQPGPIAQVPPISIPLTSVDPRPLGPNPSWGVSLPGYSLPVTTTIPGQPTVPTGWVTRVDPYGRVWAVSAMPSTTAQQVDYPVLPTLSKTDSGTAGTVPPWALRGGWDDYPPRTIPQPATTVRPTLLHPRALYRGGVL